MKASLRAKLILSYSLLALLLTLSLLFAANKLLERQFQSYMQERQEQKNNDIVEAVTAEFVRTGSLSTEFSYAMGQTALSRGIIFMIGDITGNMQFCMSDIYAAECENMLEAMALTMDRLYPGIDGEYTEKSYPIMVSGTERAVVTLGYYGPFYPGDEDVRFIEVINRVFLLVSLVFLASSVALGAWMAGRISRPLKDAISGTRAIGLGRYSSRIESHSGTREIAELVDSVNALAEALERQKAAQKRMAGDYTHEFRTPLTALQSNLEGMIDGIFEATPERLEGCRAEILRLSRMVSELDRIVELESNEPALNKEIFDLAELSAQVLASFEKQCLDKRIEKIFIAEPCKINADRDRINRVIVNLISNAIKYTGEDGTIEVRIRGEGDAAVLTVKDNGIGIEEKDLPYIFESLYRADPSRARGTGGSGIGLSVVRAILSAHGGTVTVRSEPGKGSEFTVTLKK